MEIIINGKQACLKRKTSFQFIAENRLFTGSDSYTLTITFPLRGCPQNIAIFGHIHRKDVKKSKVVFDCDIRDRNFFKSGSITVTEISETEVKTQFLEGRSEQNFNETFDDIYLNELSLGYPQNISAGNYEPANVMKAYPHDNWTALPWVNNTSGNLQNSMRYDTQNGKYVWEDSSIELSFQPFLEYLIKRICEVVGYTCDLSSLEQSDYKNLLVCNALPSAWDAHDFAIALPHWSLTEFFEQLEYFLDGEFVINHKTKSVSFDFAEEGLRTAGNVEIERIVDSYTTEVTQDDESGYIGLKNLVFADNDNRLWAYRSCQWYIRDHKKAAVEFDTLDGLLEYAKTLQISGVYESKTGSYMTGMYTRGYKRGSDGNKLFYAKDVDTYFIMYCYKSELAKTFSGANGETWNFYKYWNRLEPVNQFGKREVDKDADEVEIDIVPAWIDDTEEELGQCLFLECGEMGDAVTWTESTDENGTSSSGTGWTSGNYGKFGSGVRKSSSRSSSTGSTSGSAATLTYDNGDDGTDYNDGALAQGKAGKAIANGEQDKSDDYFDKLYVAFWDGDNRRNVWGKLPCPIVDRIITNDDFTKKITNHTMRLTDRDTSFASIGSATYHIDGKKKYNFSFLSKSIPDPRAVFYIQGGKYVCEKITATFTENGMSQLLKGVFYRIEE